MSKEDNAVTAALKDLFENASTVENVDTSNETAKTFQLCDRNTLIENQRKEGIKRNCGKLAKDDSKPNNKHDPRHQPWKWQFEGLWSQKRKYFQTQQWRRDFNSGSRNNSTTTEVTTEETTSGE